MRPVGTKVGSQNHLTEAAIAPVVIFPKAGKPPSAVTTPNQDGSNGAIALVAIHPTVQKSNRTFGLPIRYLPHLKTDHEIFPRLRVSMKSIMILFMDAMPS
jgi:hypothetical protein